MSSGLFKEDPIIALPDGAKISVFREWLSKTDAQVFHSNFLDTIKWEQPIIRIAGQARKIPRLQAWYGDPNAVFSYSGTRFQPHAFTDQIEDLKHWVQLESGHEFNSVLVNLYRNEHDSMGWHADDEKEFGPNPVIASLSLGQTRRFCLKPKPHQYERAQWRRGKRSIEIELHSGDLMVMHEDVQVDWLHSLPKETSPCESRINFTFRKVCIA